MSGRQLVGQRFPVHDHQAGDGPGEHHVEAAQPLLCRRLGDIAQGTTPWATADWSSTLQHLGKPDGHVEVLRRGYRVPAAVLDLASRLLPHMAPGVAAAESVRENPGTLDVRRSADPVAETAAAVGDVLAHPGSVGVIEADSDVAAVARHLGVGHVVLGSGDEGTARVAVVPASLAKGLEYDHVVVVEPARIVAAEPSAQQGLRRLYVVLTRAVTGLVVVHGEPLPDELAA